MNPNVFIINDSGHDFAPAEEYGTLVRMSEGTVEKFNLTEMLRMFQPFIDSSGPEDYLVQSGPAVMSAIACAAYSAKHGRLNLLLWKADRRSGDHYVLRKLIFR